MTTEPQSGLFSVKLLIMHAFAAFPFPDMPDKASIQFTHSSAWVLEATRATVKGQ